ncbi:hypothetical protein CWE04_11250 [Thomasclavelia cocleata]|uniref:Uncharacterized protein n=1 Tax=Thomasclavelia cocleata TaxID=69824 RepID=A0A1I0BEL4_9FIRM|nr:hypothetical protein [Thomasclavelia cocleata]MCR1959896.1 hypothetical protein [Thomasclavelia cocleata]NDO41758.1 hypothetical protein [Thomasclavelia cocleata]PJN79785.1 hypothetical protein CWE04_11250 [Thomasclavelia cocleata]SET05396.1 hypothetical protein SAMN04489758_10196 [Thomasclavelia cocleata]
MNELENDCVIICREVNKFDDTITSYKCKEGTYKDLSKDFRFLIFRSMFNQELKYFICNKNNVQLALNEISDSTISILKYCTEIKRC